MALKHKIEKLDDVPETARPFYAESNGAFYLQVEGMVPKERLDEFRTNNINLQNTVTQLTEKYKDVDPVKYQELITLSAKTPEEIEKAVKARVAQMAEEHQNTVKDLTTKLGATNSQLDTLVVDGSLRTAAAKAGVLPTALEDVVLRGRMVFKRADGQLQALNEKGEKLYDKDGTSPLAVDSWLKDLKKVAPHLFEGMRGAGGTGNNGGGGGGGFDMSKASTTDKIAAGLAALDQRG